MNLKFAFPLLAMVLLIVLPRPNSGSSSDYFQDEFKPIITSGLKSFNDETIRLNAVATDYANGKTSLAELRAQLTTTRKAYKNIETVLEYYFPKHCKAYINGAPLKHLDPYPVKEEFNSNTYYVVTPEQYSKDIPLDQLDTEHYRGEQRVIDPVGLQTLDELIFADEAPQSKKEIQGLTQKLVNSLPALISAVHQRNYFYDFEIIEAARLEVVRIFSMGVTGFDTPGSLNALPEAIAALQGIENITAPLTRKIPPQEQQQLRVLFANAKAYLKKNNNFNGFDRLTFLTEYINPMYKALGNVQRRLKLPSSAERWVKIPSWNAESTNLFSDDFLNPYYYSLLTKEKDSDSLRLLGKKLFYDTTLSKSGSMSCASCHKPELAFTDGQKTSLSGVEGKRVLRNSPTLINAVFSDRYFYDLRATDLEEQAEHVIANHLEFNTSFEEIEKKLNADPVHKKQFTALFLSLIHI